MNVSFLLNYMTIETCVEVIHVCVGVGVYVCLCMCVHFIPR